MTKNKLPLHFRTQKCKLCISNGLFYCKRHLNEALKEYQEKEELLTK